MATALADRSTRQVLDPAVLRPIPPAPAPRRNRSRIALGTLIVALSVLASMVLYSRADDRVEAIALRRTIQPGEQLSADDFVTVSVNADSGLDIVTPADAQLAIGRTATAPLPSGTLLSLGQLADDAGLPVGTVVVGAILQPGQFPIGLDVGDSVRVVATPESADTDGQPLDVGSAMVLDSAAAESGDDLVVSLAVPVENSTTIATAGAEGRLVLIVEPAA